MNENLSPTLVFIDSNVANYQTLQQQVNPDAEVVILDSSKDGIEQITEALKGRENIASVQILSHGGEGVIQIGTTLLNGDNLQAYREKLQQWRSSLTDKADILLYGCSVGFGRGEEFIKGLSELTGADVAASENITGNPALGVFSTWNYCPIKIKSFLLFFFV